ncbi:helix-turn-helix domain-containing protein [Bacillus andreraoultii]|uniref:helix-turn-helix domain-containing protein n=1 Tax=Bacillus andreraoultii TaxID=1499685 RepID=UPI0005A7D4F8|nr:helix-turn-helix transcriptional regulator [Bacillus andreraoultii]
MNSKEFGQYLRTLRKAKRLTIDELAAELGVSNAYISQIETGKKGIPSPELLKQFHMALDVTYEHLMEKAGYVDASLPLSQDLYSLFKDNQALYYRGIRLTPNQQRLLKDLLEEFISSSIDT